jgi:hypothetical protein
MQAEITCSSRPPIVPDLEAQRGPALADRRCTSAHSLSLTGYSTGQTSHVANPRSLSRHPSASTCSAPPPPLKRRRPPSLRCRLLRCPRRRQRTVGRCWSPLPWPTAARRPASGASGRLSLGSGSWARCVREFYLLLYVRASLRRHTLPGANSANQYMLPIEFRG